MTPQLYTIYKKEVVPALKEEFGFQNIMEVPRISKVVLNVGFGRQNKDNAHIENVLKTLETISGQKPVRTKAKKSISNFKLREGMEIGAMVTLRGPQMYEFLYKLIHLVFPRVRDFRGLTIKNFDKRGNYSVGFKEHIAFPEITTDNIDKIHGLQVVVTTTAKTKKEGVRLLSKMGFPFHDADKVK